MTDAAAPPPGMAPEAVIARLLGIGTVASMLLMLVGVVLMAVRGVDPLTAEPALFDPSAVVADITALRPAGFLWAGIALIIALQVARVGLELVSAVRHRDRAMVAISGGILIVVLIAIIVALT